MAVGVKAPEGYPHFVVTACNGALSAKPVTVAPPDGLEPQQQRGVLDWYLEVG